MGLATLYVSPQFWAWVAAAVPVPYTHWYLREQWRSAVDRAWPDARRNYRVHDLRHLALQLLSDAKVPVADIQAQARHRDPKQTLQYLLQTARKGTAVQMETLFPALTLDGDAARRLLLKKVED